VLTAIRFVADNQVAQAQSVERRRFEIWVPEAVLIAECLGAPIFSRGENRPLWSEPILPNGLICLASLNN
jgi:hypothetical protein